MVKYLVGRTYEAGSSGASKGLDREQQVAGYPLNGLCESDLNKGHEALDIDVDRRKGGPVRPGGGITALANELVVGWATKGLAVGEDADFFVNGGTKVG